MDAALNFVTKYAKALAGVVVAFLVVVAAITVLGSGSPQRTVTAHFTRATGLYKGSSVRVLGVYERRGAAGSLYFRYDLQGQRRLTRGLRPVDLHYTAAR